MHAARWIIGSALAITVANVTGRTTGAAPARGPIDACTLLTLDEVRAIVGARVTIFAIGSNGPKTEGEVTVSNCTYTLSGQDARGARVMLMWGPAATLVKTNEYYIKRNKERSVIKGGVFVIASVTNANAQGMVHEAAASEKLMAAALAKL